MTHLDRSIQGLPQGRSEMMRSSLKRRFHYPVLVSYWFPVLLSLAFLSSCGSSENLQIAANAVEQFHSQLNAEQYQQLYAGADEGFQRATKQEDLVALLQAIHAKLGRVQSSQRTNFQVGVSTGQGTTVSLVYNSTFERGPGTEQFLFHMRNGQAALLGYHINSNALVVR
jgi:hypothetical protein